MTATNDWRTTYAAAWARALPEVLARTYPYSTQHVSSGPDDCDVTPTTLHPSFHGCFDWHSSCHMVWSAVRLLTLAPDQLDEGTTSGLVTLLDDRLVADKIATEVTYLRNHPSYERPYGWGWAAMLAAATANCPAPQSDSWASATRPLFDEVVERVADWIPRLRYAVRSGEHSNVAFGLGLVLDAADALGDNRIRPLVEERARFWFGNDRDYPASWEPGGSDFLSPALAEADLMRRVLPKQEFTAWLAAFLPGLDSPDHHLWALPEVVDPTDGKGAHLLGLALSRSAQLRSIASVAFDEPTRARLHEVTQSHIDSTSAHIVEGDFMATHWLISFAILASTA